MFFLTASAAVLMLSTAFTFLPVPKGYDVQAHITPGQTVKVSSNIGSILNNNKNITGTFSRYENKTNGISIDYPSEWSVNSTAHIPKHPDIKVISLVSMLGSSLEVIQEPLPYKDISLNEFVNASLYMAKGMLPNFQIIQNLTPANLAGYPASYAGYTFASGKLLMKVKSITTITNEKGYTILYMNSKDSFDTFLPIAQRMINSFKIANTTSNSSYEKNAIGKFLRYENNTVGFSMDYPSGWIVNYSPNLATDLLRGLE